MKHKKLFLMGLMLILFIFNIILTSSILFLLKHSITYINTLIAFILTIIAYLIIMKKENYNLKEKIIHIFSFLIIVILSIFISGVIIDTTYDSNTYHKIAVGQLKNGWNPVYESVSEFNEKSDNKIKQINNYDLWVDHYAKGYYIYASSIYSITNNIETGKSINIITIIATFLICFSCLSIKFNNKITFFISSLLSLNPVMICQFGTFYNDGLLGNFLLTLLISLSLIINKNEIVNKYYNYILYFISLVILINIKFTGLAYAGIYSVIYYLYILINKKERKEKLKTITIIGISSLIIGALLIGNSSYLKNIKEHNHPFYPLFGKNKVDIMTGNTPHDLRNMNRIKRFIYANFSNTYNILNEPDHINKLKIPFTFKLKELIYYIGPDARVGGYGVLFSGVIILSIILLYLIIKNKKMNKELLFPILGTLLLIIILKDAWWARYLPQLYFIPIFILIVFNDIKIKEKITKSVNIILISILILNSILIGGPQLWSLRNQTILVNKDYKELENIDKNKEIIIIEDEYTGAIYNLYDKHNKIKILNEIENKEDYIEKTFLGPRIELHTYIKKEKE